MDMYDRKLIAEFLSEHYEAFKDFCEGPEERGLDADKLIEELEAE